MTDLRNALERMRGARGLPGDYEALLAAVSGSAEERAKSALAEMGILLDTWQPTRCGYGGGGCSWPHSSHLDGGLVPQHDYQPVPDGPPSYLLRRLPHLEAMGHAPASPIDRNGRCTSCLPGAKGRGGDG